LLPLFKWPPITRLTTRHPTRINQITANRIQTGITTRKPIPITKKTITTRPSKKYALHSITPVLKLAPERINANPAKINMYIGSKKDKSE